VTPSNEFGVRSILETAAEEPLALYRNADWETRFPRVVCGVTGTTAGGDFGLSTARSRGRLHAAYDRLAAQLGFGAVALAQQVHGRRVRRVRLRLDPAAVARTTDGPAPALRLLGEADGLLCDGPGVLLAVSVADCVPIHVLDPEGEAALLLHAGWRGVASGILESGLSRIVACTDAQIGSLWVHLGPAICGRCYEVGPQVMTSLGRPAERGCVDLRSELTKRALGMGVPRVQVSVSAWCSRCSGDRFHSHRGSQGKAGRMAAFLGWRAAVPPSVARQGLPG
jgi:YfiH family protein